jgi:hypothetical protein
MKDETSTELKRPPYTASAIVAIIILVILLGVGIYLMLNGDVLADEAVLSTTSPSPNIVEASPSPND